MCFLYAQSVCFGFCLWILQCPEEPRTGVHWARVQVRAARQETASRNRRTGCTPSPCGCYSIMEPVSRLANYCHVPHLLAPCRSGTDVGVEMA